MDKQYTGARFDIRIQYDEVLSTKQTVFVKLDYTCSCYNIREHKKAEFIKVEKNNNTPIMVSDAIEAMINYGVDPDCKHFTLIGFIKNTDIQFTTVWGT